MFKFILLLAILFLFLSSCSNIHTNIGPYARNEIQKSIRSSVVDEYSRNEILQLNATTLGQVETEYCQVNLLGGLPPENKLNKALRAKAQQLGGNAIVYDSCHSGRNYMNCEKYIRCQATAYRVKY